MHAERELALVPVCERPLDDPTADDVAASVMKVTIRPPLP
jgi:hypothetical protein